MVLSQLPVCTTVHFEYVQFEGSESTSLPWSHRIVPAPFCIQQTEASMKLVCSLGRRRPNARMKRPAQQSERGQCDVSLTCGNSELAADRRTR